uniref:Receptor-like serine/threonine-protein kinase n=1 Tax=Gossypium raimondii TaxID=29730 RepID=A0A0D2SZB9_GOSRA|nr:hypothetical protein B456_006G169900 [Gossypium raimondii]
MRSQTLTSSSSTIFLVFVIYLCFCPSSSGNPKNFLQTGSSLSVEDDTDMLTSSDNTFTCGFYGVSENAYYFSIWFTSSKDKTIAWMANRYKPVNGKGSKLPLHRDGAFVLTDVDGSIMWEANTRTTYVERAELLDNGNLVLKNSSGKVVWQSFDFPTDTLLPHQRFTKSKKLISILGRGNYGTGYFNFFFDTDNVLRLVYDGPDISSVYWPNDCLLDDMGWFLSSDWLNFNGSDLGFGIRRRLTMDYDGNLRLYSLNIVSGLWTIRWEAVRQLCSVHGLCGRNGICVYTPEPKCSCPPGYEMADPSNRNKGCKPRFSRICSSKSPQQVKFVKMRYVDFDGFDSSYNCQCNAFSYRLTGDGNCFTKVELFNGYDSPNFPGALYLKHPLSIETSEVIVLNGTNHTCKLGETTGDMGLSNSFASVIGAIQMLFFVSGWWFLFRKSGIPAMVEEGYRVLSNHFRKFSYMELKKATKNFEEEQGRGASGVVFKGVLADERVVAVKKLGDAHLTEEVFWAEVSIIGEINHMNLVRMWGFCLEPKHRLLVYEYVENRSLDKHLFSGNVLGWNERFKVALGTAKGLAYLHHECLEWVIHCDVKPENILLDGEFEPKISDFGLAKLSERDRNNSEMSRIRGTKGYMAPDWALNLPITAKVDVYSYGVVILELVKGIRLSNWVTEDGDEQETELTRFIKVVKRKIQIEEMAWVEDTVDTRLNGHFTRIQAKKMIEIGISCVDENRSKRPTMDSIVQALLECED